MLTEEEIVIVVKDLATLYIIVGQERRIEYEDNLNAKNNLNREESLIVLN